MAGYQACLQRFYNTIVGVQAKFRVSYPIGAISKLNCIPGSCIGKSVSNEHLGSSNDMCYIQNGVIMQHILKRLRCINELKALMILEKTKRTHT